VNEPLDPVEDRLALRAIELGRLLSDEAFDVGIRSVREEAGSSDERVPTAPQYPATASANEALAISTEIIPASNPFGYPASARSCLASCESYG